MHAKCVEYCCFQNQLGREEGVIWFQGERMRDKDDFSLKMYQDEVEVRTALHSIRSNTNTTLH